MQENKSFDAEGLFKKTPSHRDRLKWWNEKLCREQPQLFDIALAVSVLSTLHAA
jgi:NAD+ kinase